MTSLFHVGITVSDLERAVRFYTQGLDFEESFRQTSAASYLGLTGYPGVEIAAVFVKLEDGLALELQEYRRVDTGAARAPGTAPPGSSHLSLRVDDLDHALERAERAGGRRVTDPIDVDSGVNAGARAVYLRDPDGYTIELFQRPTTDP
jgi:catechol 2,3-dioxygenase-like lactoylglutathione lyase family enzyme